MKILSAEQIKQLDQYTIAHEPVASIDLMERAASNFFEKFSLAVRLNRQIHVYCGMGNNGGDGLAIARMLIEAGYLHVSIFVINHTPKPTADFLLNQQRLENISGIHYINTSHQLLPISSDTIVVDAIFGIGLSRAVDGLAGEVIAQINNSGAEVYSVDIPSGLFCDQPNNSTDTIIKAKYTYTFHCPKKSFMYSANEMYVSAFEVLDIGLDKNFEAQIHTDNYFLTKADVSSFFKARSKFSHKGVYGHALLAAGSIGKIGAAVLAVKAALRSGTGLVTALVPHCGYTIMQTANPAAMVATNGEDFLENAMSFEKYYAMAIGPGIGTNTNTSVLFEQLLDDCTAPLVIDADALNIVAHNKSLLNKLPAGSILTPHPGEFKRLVGEWQSDSHKLELQQNLATKYNVVVVLKGAHTSVCSPEGKLWFNETGNAGMAKGGSGDVLTGIIVALLAQSYTSLQAALLAVYIHGLAGDIAAINLGQTAMNAEDLIRYLPKAFLSIEFNS